MITSFNVGMTGFEPATSSSRTKRATRLRYSPNAISGPVCLRSVLDRRGGRGCLASRSDVARRKINGQITRQEDDLA